jgi:ligand-binding sensor domain-containing protein/DNA-binding CsgD family transcriptional regulator
LNKSVYFILAFLLSINSASGQIKSKGIPFIVNYTKSDYNASTQSWSITQDGRGIIYFGNNYGLLEFDGTEWRLYRISNNSTVRSVASDKYGRILLGAFNEFGFMEPNRQGELNYHSLVNKIPVNDRNFGEVWKIHISRDNEIIFQSFTNIFILKNDTIEVIKGNFQFSFYVNDRLFVQVKNSGLYELTGRKLTMLNGGEIFSDNYVWTMLPTKRREIIIGTSDNGLYKLSQQGIKKWKTQVDEFFVKNQIYCGTRIYEDYYAIGTIQDGVLVINSEGQPVQHLNRLKGIQNNTILSIYSDNDKNLWLGLDNGIDYIKISSPISFLYTKKELGAGYASIIFNGNLYLGTNQGLFFNKWLEDENPLDSHYEYTLVENTKGQIWNLTNIEGALFCGHNNGIFLIRKERARLISEVEGGWMFLQLPDYPDNVIAGTYTGLLLFERQTENSGGWKFKTIIAGFSESCREMEVDKEGSIWMSHAYKGVYRIKLNDLLDSVAEVEFFNSASGLPSDYGNSVLKFKDEVVVSTIAGFYKYHKTENKFEQYDYFNSIFGGRQKINKIFTDSSGNYWYFGENGLFVLKKNFDGTYNIEQIPFNFLKGTFISTFENFYQIDQKNFIISTEDGFVHFDPSIVRQYNKSFRTLIRKVEILNDSVLFGGTFVDTNKMIVSTRPYYQLEHINYKYNSLRFIISTPFYESKNNVQFSYYLEGFDDGWSGWTDNTAREYTNLTAGDYIFRAKARNVFNIESDESSFHFIVLPPWYRSTWALLGYLILIGVLVYIFIKVLLARIEKEKEKVKNKKDRELKEQKEKYIQESLVAEQEIIRLKNEKLEIEVQRNKAELESKSKELAAIAMQITNKNEILNQIKAKLEKIQQKMIHEQSKKQVSEVIKTIKEDMLKEDDWEKFEVHFDQVHEDFLKRLRTNYPALTPKDLRLCAYLRMNLSTKEIAPLLNISVRGVEISRYRLRKKFDIERVENLIDFLLNV